MTRRVVPCVKRHLKSLLLRTRGIHAYPLVLAMVEEMTDAQAEQWFRVLQNTQEDAKRDGERSGARQPWKHGGFFPHG